MWYPPATEAKAFPTAALSTSSIWDEGDYFLSARNTSSPVFIFYMIHPFSAKHKCFFHANRLYHLKYKKFPVTP